MSAGSTKARGAWGRRATSPSRSTQLVAGAVRRTTRRRPAGPGSDPVVSAVPLGQRPARSSAAPGGRAATGSGPRRRGSGPSTHHVAPEQLHPAARRRSGRGRPSPPGPRPRGAAVDQVGHQAVDGPQLGVVVARRVRCRGPPCRCRRSRRRRTARPREQATHLERQRREHPVAVERGVPEMGGGEAGAPEVVLGHHRHGAGGPGEGRAGLEAGGRGRSRRTSRARRSRGSSGAR